MVCTDPRSGERGYNINKVNPYHEFNQFTQRRTKRCSGQQATDSRLGIDGRGLVIGRRDAATRKDSAARRGLIKLLADGARDFEFVRGHLSGVCVSNDQTQERCGSPAIYFRSDDCISIVLVVLRGISLYDRGNKVWWQRSDLDGLHYVVDFSHRTRRSKLALHFANLGLRVYEPNRQAPKDGQVGVSDVVVRRGNWSRLLLTTATLLLNVAVNLAPDSFAHLGLATLQNQASSNWRFLLRWPHDLSLEQNNPVHIFRIVLCSDKLLHQSRTRQKSGSATRSQPADAGHCPHTT